jgi:cell shape-determining protein MreD
LIDKLLSRPILLGLALIGVCILVYFVGAFYHQFLNNPLDFASLVFIIAIYVGAVYHQVQGFEKK